MRPFYQNARALLALMVLGILVFQAHAADKLNLQEFTALYMQRAKQEDPGLTFSKADADTYDVTLGNGRSGNVYLGNAYREYLADPQQIDEIINRYLQILVQSVNAPEDEGLNIDTIVPIVRTSNYFDPLADKPGFDKSQYITEPVVPGLMVIYAFDRAQSIRPVLRDDLGELNLNPADVPELARKNLIRLYGSNMSVGGEDGFYYMADGTSYESSMILLDIWSKENFPVKGDIVVFMPGRNFLLITGSKDPQALQHGKKVARQIVAEESHPMTETPLVRRNGKWEIFKP